MKASTAGRMLDGEQVREAADRLMGAERIGKPIGQLSQAHPGMTVDDAYAVQREGIRRRMDAGAVVRGYKIGLTSVAMQRMMGVDEPDYGHLLDDMFVLETVPVRTGELLQPRVEPELAFVLGHDLPEGRVTVADVLRCTDFVLPCLEIIDSRYDAWRITLPDTVADNASSARVVLGGVPRSLRGLDLAALGVVLRVNGQIVESGASGAVLGNPVNAVAWLANALAGHDVRLKTGDVVLSGSATRAVDVHPGDHVEAVAEDLGAVRTRFI
ncbi:2-keto-4-pentenoate hydratase [Nonomuraea guangzhouensis]|uniref:2-keto-4-pentenoate hydratase n=1 Tax=Nonomuraea guangzhouensis TaxID=1291555 RepID=A0ABW4GCH0_9ACTN|nr:2-keto-4-pentenoate hydratase [Nonomuraea guangzhouensis]